jgi:2-octaprenyl-6-methoxyphenol hydroxylase
MAKKDLVAAPRAPALRHDYRQTAWVGIATFDTDTPAVRAGVAYERFTAHGPAALLPLKDGRAGLVWCVDSGDDPVRDLDDTQRVTVLNAIFHPRTPRLAALTPLKEFPLGLSAERTLTEGRIVRIGNAAQTLHPVAGQGLNLGLRDAFLLVDRLANSARIPGSEGHHPSQSGLPLGGQRREERGGPQFSDAGVTRALRGLAFARAPDRWSVIGATDFLARSFTWHAPGLAAARGLGLAALQAVPPFKRAFARQMMFGWR